VTALAAVLVSLGCLSCKAKGDAARRDSGSVASTAPARGLAPVDAGGAARVLDAGGATTDAGVAGTEAGAVPIASPDVLIDAPPWPARDKRVTLTWLVPPAAPDPRTVPGGDSASMHDVTLAVRVGQVERRVHLGAVQGGPVVPKNQKACAQELRISSRGAQNLRARQDVATMPIGHSGDYGYAVRRDTATSLAVVAYSTDDGNCPDAKGNAHPCPRQSVVLARVQIPEGAAFEEALTAIDDTGKERPFACAPATP
jgi:hypothetical protein